MSKYVNHSHGLVIGSDNIFYLESSDGIFRDHYKAIVFPNTYNYKNDDLARYCYSIQTPAQQLLWKMYDHVEDENWGKYYLSPSMNYWLTENIGAKFDKWDARKVNHTDAEPVFFKGRNDAFKFVKFLKSLINNTYFEK